MSESVIQIAQSPEDIADALALIVEYARWLEVDHSMSLDFQNIDEELARFPGKYTPPDGALILARDAAGDGKALGVICLRRHDTLTCEIKRLYVRPAGRGRRLGKRLIGELLTLARQRGYERALLDTAAFMPEAQALYEAFGFSDIPAYYENPVACCRFMERKLDD